MFNAHRNVFGANGASGASRTSLATAPADTKPAPVVCGCYWCKHWRWLFPLALVLAIVLASQLGKSRRGGDA